jgi:alpha-1,6-mannosyltransferase
VVVLGWLSGHWSFGRSWPMLMFTVQVALAVHVAELAPGRVRLAWGVPVATATALGLWTQAGALLVVMPSAMRTAVSDVIGEHTGMEEVPHADWLENYVKPTDVVLADTQLSQFEIAAHGAYNVSSPWYLPEVNEAEDMVRADAMRAMMDSDTPPAERLALAAAVLQRVAAARFPGRTGGRGPQLRALPPDLSRDGAVRRRRARAAGVRRGLARGGRVARRRR